MQTLVFVGTCVGTKALMQMQGVLTKSLPYESFLLTKSPSNSNLLSQFLLYGDLFSRSSCSRISGRAFLKARLKHPKRSFNYSIGLTCISDHDNDLRSTTDKFCATWISARSRYQSLTLELNTKIDKEELEITVSAVLAQLIQVCGTPLFTIPDLSLPMKSDFYPIHSYVQKLLEKKIPYFIVDVDGRVHETMDTQNKKALVCGSFNPLHSGHLKLFQVAESLLNTKAYFELSLFNADPCKPPLNEEEALDRISQFAGTWPVIVSNSPTFTLKSSLFPNTAFVVGHDTAIRIIQKKFYGDSEENLKDAMENLKNLGSYFLVAGRDLEGVFHTCDNIQFPSFCEGLFVPITPEMFRLDVSSSDLRRLGTLDEQVFGFT